MAESSRPTTTREAEAPGPSGPGAGSYTGAETGGREPSAPARPDGLGPQTRISRTTTVSALS